MQSNNHVIKRLLEKARLWIKRKKAHDVEFHGRKFTVVSKRKPAVPAQQYVDGNAVICGSCGSLMLPGSRIWICQPRAEADLRKPGVLPVSVGDGKQGLAACLDWDCCPTAAFMCGELQEGRKIAFFESPAAKAMRTGEAVCVPDVGSYPE